MLELRLRHSSANQKSALKSQIFDIMVRCLNSAAVWEEMCIFIRANSQQKMLHKADERSGECLINSAVSRTMLS